MHIHTMAPTASSNALAGAQGAENAQSLRRARELRDAAAKLKAAALDIGTPFETKADSQAQESTQPSAAVPVSFWA
jgi:hypothetical protein